MELLRTVDAEFQLKFAFTTRGIITRFFAADLTFELRLAKHETL